MFKDYYLILEINENATQAEIKSAFKKQALKWHPDKNIGNDTTIRMQEINEAYLILKDVEARERYLREYQQFKYYQKQYWENQKQPHEYKKYEYEENENDYSDYKVKDDILYSWIKNARRQAVDLAIQTIKEMRELTIIGTKAAGKEMGTYFIGYLAVGFIFTVIFGLTRGCN